MLSLVAALVLAKAPQPSLLDFAVRQWQAQPQTRIEDAYKWLFQATQGGEHAIADAKEAKAWLDREWKSLGKPLVGEPAAVALTPNATLVRFNLRPFKSAGGTERQVLDAFVRSAKAFRHDHKSFVRAWHDLGTRLRRAPIGRLSETDWRRLDRRAKASGYPMMEHSTEYLKRYRPAYRVMLLKLVPKAPAKPQTPLWHGPRGRTSGRGGRPISD